MTALEQLLILINGPNTDTAPRMFMLIDWNELREQLKPAIEAMARESGRTADLSDETVLTSHWSVTCEECQAQGVASHREDCSLTPVAPTRPVR